MNLEDLKKNFVGKLYVEPGASVPEALKDLKV